jgi:tRNA-dihydrouridine synthase B
MIHPRTGVQQYEGTVDLDHFAEASGKCRHPVVYNGDIRSIDDFTGLEEKFPTIKRWMIGRGVVHNPFLLSELKTGNRQSPDYEVLRSFHSEIFVRNRERLCGPAHLLGKMKEFWWYLHAIFPDGRKWLKKIQRSTSVDRYNTLVETLFGETG